MVISKTRAAAIIRPAILVSVFLVALSAAMLIAGCGSSQGSKNTTYEDCDVYDYDNNLLRGSETVYPGKNGAEVRGYFEDYQVYVLHIGTDYEAWVAGGRSSDDVRSGCYFMYTADGSRHVLYYFDNSTKDHCWKIPLYDKDGEDTGLDIYLKEDGVFSYSGSTKQAGSCTPDERDKIDSKGEFYFDQARETMSTLDPSFLLRANPEMSTPANELAEQSSKQQGDDVAAEETTGVPEGAISYTEAKSHVGETIAVYGEVKASEYRSESNYQPTYIDLGAPYPDESRVTMVVWGEDRGNFPGAPESIYLGRTVCVTGELYDYEGVVYVKVETPDQVQVLG